jgi:hypothetical protein
VDKLHDEKSLMRVNGNVYILTNKIVGKYSNIALTKTIVLQINKKTYSVQEEYPCMILTWWFWRTCLPSTSFFKIYSTSTRTSKRLCSNCWSLIGFWSQSNEYFRNESSFSNQISPIFIEHSNSPLRKNHKRTINSLVLFFDRVTQGWMIFYR